MHFLTYVSTCIFYIHQRNCIILTRLHQNHQPLFWYKLFVQVYIVISVNFSYAKQLHALIQNAIFFFKYLIIDIFSSGSKFGKSQRVDQSEKGFPLMQPITSVCSLMPAVSKVKSVFPCRIEVMFVACIVKVTRINVHVAVK